MLTSTDRRRAGAFPSSVHKTVRPCTGRSAPSPKDEVMTRSRRAGLSLAVSAAALSTVFAVPALAQQAPGATEVEEIVITGTRVANRSRLDTLARSTS